MARKDRKIILVAQCLLNPYCRVHILGKNFGLSREVIDYLLDNRVGIISYPCPELTAMGLGRNPQGRQQYDNVFFRAHCRETLKAPMRTVREFIRNGYRLTCFIGLENSPSCGVRWCKHKTNKYQTESPVPADDPGETCYFGVMTECVSGELAKDKISAPLLELPALSPAGSPRVAAFWARLRAAVGAPKHLR